MKLILLLFACCVIFVPSVGAQNKAVTGDLESARKVAEWLRSVAHDTPDGRAWPGDAEDPEALDVELGGGTAGILLFWIQLHRADPSGGFLEEVRRGADYLAANRRTSGEPRMSGEWTTGLYGPIAGVAFALNEAYKLTGDQRHRGAALALVELLHATATRDASGASWGTSHDLIMGAAGTGLFLLYAAREMEHAPSLALATEVGRKLLVRGVPDHKGGLTWKGSYEARFVLPNFSHGAAGIGYFLGALHEATRSPEFLEAARGAAAWLIEVADRSDGGFRLFYGWPDPGWERPYDIGWAHGPAGTARLFYKLWQITGEARWLELVQASARSLRSSGLPGEPRPEFGRAFELNQRFGIAGAARFFLDLYESHGSTADLEFAQSLTSVIASAAGIDGKGSSWKSRRPPFMPRAGEPAVFANYFYGAAGYGLLFLGMENALRDGDWALRLPDDPFGGDASVKTIERRTLDATNPRGRSFNTLPVGSQLHRCMR